MSRRISPRRPRRVQVQFWKRGEEHAYPGYTTNISLTGMFIATRSPQPPGTRLRIEVLEGERGFMVEGMVAHARKVRGEMMHVSQPGMGIRFLSVEDLIRELIPGGHSAEGASAPLMGAFPPDASPGPPSTGEGWGSLPERAPPPPAPVFPPTSTPAPPSAPPPAPRPNPRPNPITKPAGAPIPTPREGGGVFAVHFLSPAEFLEVFRRDIQNGGLFVSTRYPGRLQETVTVELHPPLPGEPPVQARARVVQRFEPQIGDTLGPNLLAGMGVELLDLTRVLDQLRPIVQRLG